MSRVKACVFVLFGLILSCCATPYQSNGFGGGWKVTELEPGIWRVSFNGNGYTSRETAQTYWLYRSAELTVEQGFDGFQVLSSMQFSSPGSPSDKVRLAASGGGIIFIPSAGPIYAPAFQGDIRLLKLPFQTTPGKVFNAAELKNELDPYVNGAKCGINNVCAHAHNYLYDAPPPPPPPAPVAVTAPAPSPVTGPSQ